MSNPNYRFSVELTPPLDPKGIPAYCAGLTKLLELTNKVSISSHPAGRVSGFDRSYNLAAHLRALQPPLANGQQLEILFHLTCNDLNRVNIRARLTLLRQLHVDRLLVVLGEGYVAPDESQRNHPIHYQNSTQLLEHIQSDEFRSWFKSVAIAGYPGGRTRESNLNECTRLRAKLLAATAADGVGGTLNTAVYTQCVFDAAQFEAFGGLLREMVSSQVEIVPSVALFQDRSSLERIARLTRVKLGNELMESIIGQQEGEKKLASVACESPVWRHTAKQWLIQLCKSLHRAQPQVTLNICAFGLFDLAAEIMSELQMASDPANGKLPPSPSIAGNQTDD